MAKEFLDTKKVKYEYIDVSADAKARDELMKKSGQMGVPVIDVNGEIVTGFDPERLEVLTK